MQEHWTVGDRTHDDVAQASDREYTTLGPLQVRIETHRTFSRLPEDVEASVLAALALDGSEDVIDVGCGTGTFVRRLVEGGHSGKVFALDLAEAAYEAAAAVPGVEAFHASADAIPLPDAAVDVVAARHMLYHCADPAAVVADCRRVLADDGVFVASVNHPDSIPMIRHIITTELLMLGVRTHRMVNGVTTDNVEALVGTAFADVELIRFDNELVFESPEPLLTFAEANFALYGIDADHVDRDELSGRVRRRVEDWFRENQDPWSEPKGFSVCVARGRAVTAAAAPVRGQARSRR